MISNPLRGEIWLVQLDPVVGHEQANIRPCLVLSNNIFNQSKANLFIIVPLTSQTKNFSLHVKITSNKSGLKKESFVMPEHIRSASIKRFIKPIGHIPYDVIAEVTDKIKLLLDFV